MSRPIIEVENLSKRYRLGQFNAQTMREEVEQLFARFRGSGAGRGSKLARESSEFWALKDISFSVQTGEVLGIIGRNGAGKSTLLKILNRITEPTTGTASIRGRVASLLEIGTGFHPELTGRENIYLNGAILGMTRAEVRRKFDEIVDFSGVEKFIDTPVKRYSSGMYVRLAFAVAAHLEPEILIVDEVLAVGDIEFQRKCLGKMSEVAKAGRTVLFVSHNHHALRNLCTHGVVLRNGRGSPKKNISSALDDYLSQSEMVLRNSWRRSVSTEQPGVRFESIDARLEGTQPMLRLECVCAIVSERSARPVLIAIDVTDVSSFAIMQALPRLEPFIGGAAGTYDVSLSIELPPLVPGTYALDFWIGPHNSETFDLVRGAIKFEIVESPTRGRTFPHTRDHGSVVPISSAQVRRRSDAIRRVMPFVG